MPVRFAGRRQRQARKQAAEKQKGAKSPKKSGDKDSSKAKSSPTRRAKSAPPSTTRRTKLPPVDYDQALRKLVRASEILERSTVMEKDVEENLEKIHQRLEPLRETKN